MNTRPTNWRWIRFPLVFASVVLLGVVWLILDGLRIQAKQTSVYAIPNDRSGASLLEFLRRMDGSGNAPKNPMQSSNMESICKGVMEGYRALSDNKIGLTERELREAEYYNHKYTALALTQGFLPFTDAVVAEFLSGTSSYLHHATSFNAREREVMNLTITLLEATGRIDQAVQFVERLQKQLNQRPELASDATENTLKHLGRVAERLNLLNHVLSLKSQTLDQRPFDLESLRGKAVLIEFWGTRCAPCIADFPALKRIYDAHRGRLEIVGICLTSEPARVENFIAEHGIHWIQLCDDRGAGWECNQRLAERFGITAVPSTLLLDPTGTVVKMGVRPLLSDKSLDLESCLDEIFSTKDFPNDSTIR